VTGYFFYDGHYVSPPYEVKKVRVNSLQWEVRINNLPVRKVVWMPPPDWIPTPDSEGQLDCLDAIARRCRIVLDEEKKRGASYEELKAKVEQYLGSQNLVAKISWPGKYFCQYETEEGDARDCLIMDVPYPPGEQLKTISEIRSCVASLVRQIKAEGTIEEYKDAEAVIIERMLAQELVGGALTSPTAERLEYAQRYYPFWLRVNAQMEWHGYETGMGPPATQADVEESVDAIVESFTSRLKERGFTMHFLDGTEFSGPAETGVELLPALVAVAESGLPADIRLCGNETLVDRIGGPAWILTASFQPTPELKFRIGADAEWLKQKKLLDEAEDAMSDFGLPGE
jgi:hypothetical protein